MSSLTRIFLGVIVLAMLSTSVYGQDEPAVDTWLPDNLEVITPENVSRLTELATFGRGQVTAMAWSPHGGTLALATANGLWLHDTSDWSAPAREITNYEGTIHHIAWHPDGTQLATTSIISSRRPDNAYEGSTNEELRLWDLSTTPAYSRILQSQLIFASSGGGPTWSALNTGSPLVFSPDGTWLATRDYEWGISLWHVPLGMRKALIYGDGFRLPTFSSDSAYLVQQQAGDTYRWDIRELTGYQIVNFRSMSFPVDGLVTVSSTEPGSRIIDLSCNIGIFQCEENELTVRDSLTNEVFSRFRIPYNIYSAILTPDNETILAWSCLELQAYGDSTGCARAEAVFLDAVTGVEEARMQNYYYESGFSPDSAYFVTAGEVVRIWDMASYTQVGILPEYSPVSAPIRFSPDGMLIAVNGGSTVNVWSVETGQLEIVLLHDRKVNDFAFSPDSQHIASVGYANSILLWDIPSRSETNAAPMTLNDATILSLDFDSTTDATSVSFSPDGAMLATATKSGHPVTIDVWDTAISERLASRLGAEAEYIEFSADGNFLLVSGTMECCNTPITQLWEVSQVLADRAFEAHSEYAVWPDSFSSGATFVPNTNHVIIGDTLQVWDAATSEVLADLGSTARDMVFTPDGALLFWQDYIPNVSPQLHLTDMASGLEIPAPEIGFAMPAFNLDGTLMAIVHQGSIHLWGVPQATS